MGWRESYASLLAAMCVTDVAFVLLIAFAWRATYVAHACSYVGQKCKEDRLKNTGISAIHVSGRADLHDQATDGSKG
jgi:hypothetical protein